MERALDQGRTRWRFLWPAPFVYLVVTGGFPYTVLMLVLLAAWLVVRSLGEKKRLSSILFLVGGAILGFGLAAPAWLALFDYVHGSARAAQDSVEHFQWRVPFAAFPALVLPNWTVDWADFSSRLMPHTATELASGLVAPTALLAGLIAFGRTFTRKMRWELGLLAVVLLLCMLPTANVFRWSFRWLPLLHLILAVCAAEALRSFGSSGSPLLKRPGVIGFILTLLLIGVGVLTGANGTLAIPFVWIALTIAAVWALLEISSSTTIRNCAPVSVTVAVLLATYLCLPANCGVPKYNLSQELTKPAPLDPRRLYLSVYPAPEDFYRLEKRPEPFGQTLRLGSTSMFAGVRLLNGYSPIRPSGVAREFAFAIHGEIHPDMTNIVLESDSWPDGVLAELGVDGIIVANEVGTDPLPNTEWALAVTTREGRVFHRRAEPFEAVRSVTTIESRPNEQFVPADVSRIVNERNGIEADVAVPEGPRPALLAISRPYFPGYRANLGNRPVQVTTLRGLMPLIELAPGTRGRLSVVYRPWWLIWGTGIASASLLVIVGSIVVATTTRKSLTQ
jgi:hypothetical protein